MEAHHLLPLITILLLGAFHGINPGMGWLFAVALGMQERRQGAVWQALIPLTLGHGIATGAVILIAVAAGVAVPAASLKLPVAILLMALGIHRLFRHSHFTGSGMQVGIRGLTVWSFLMATCHGAGLMVVPALLGMTATVGGASCHLPVATSAGASIALTATLVHTAGYLIVTTAVAWVVFTKFGVRLLRTAWVNLDLIWAVALIATGVLTAVV